MNTLFVGQEIIHLDSVDSTNNYTSQLVRQTVRNEGLVVYANHQTGGKGQRGKKWESHAAQNLLCSFFFKPKRLKASAQFKLTQAISLGVLKTVESLAPTDVSIKWPNDILVGSHKIAGILVENTLSDSYISKSIVGIGLNVNQERFTTDYKATSLKLLTGQHIPVQHVLAELCKNIEIQYLRLNANTDALQEDYQRKMYRRNLPTAFQMVNRAPEMYKVLGVEDSGNIVLESSTGEVAAFGFHETKFIR